MNDNICIENMIKENHKLITDINRNVELYQEYIQKTNTENFNSIDEVLKSSMNDIFKLSLKLLETNHFLKVQYTLENNNDSEA